MNSALLFFSTFLALCINISCFASKTSILFVRHGQTDWNVENRAQGHTDNPLNSTGILQAKLVADKLSKEHPEIQAIYSSDLSRAYNTAKETALKFNLPITTSTSLRERYGGVSEGMLAVEIRDLYKDKFKELSEKYPDKWELWKYTPIEGEETILELINRITNEVNKILQDQRNAKKIAIFSHGKAIKAFIASITDKRVREIVLHNCCIVEISYDSENTEQPFEFISINN